MPKKVLIAPATLANIDGQYLQVLHDAGFELVYPRRVGQMTEEELINELPGIAASLAGSEPYTRLAIESAHELRVIARAGVGYDAVDVQAATDRGIAVAI